jgi:rubrerythrin
MRLSEHLRACIDLELRAAEVYNSLHLLFPEARELFRELSLSEDDHANTLIVATGFERLLDTEKDFPVSKLPEVEKVRGMLDDISAKIDAGQLSSVEDTLSMLLELESAQAEGYFSKMMSESDSEIIKRLRQVYEDEKAHYEKLRDFLRDTPGTEAG